MATRATPVEPQLLPSLESARTIVWPMLHERVRALQPDLARVCLHHLGLTDADAGRLSGVGARGSGRCLRAPGRNSVGQGNGVHRVVGPVLGRVGRQPVG